MTGWYMNCTIRLQTERIWQKRWKERILDKLPELSPKTYCIAIPLLRMGGGVNLEQVAFLLDKAEGREKGSCSAI